MYRWKEKCSLSCVPLRMYVRVRCAHLGVCVCFQQKDKTHSDNKSNSSRTQGQSYFWGCCNSCPLFNCVLHISVSLSSLIFIISGWFFQVFWGWSLVKASYNWSINRILHPPLPAQAFLIMRPHFLRSLPPLAGMRWLLVRRVLGYTQLLERKQ